MYLKTVGIVTAHQTGCQLRQPSPQARVAAERATLERIDSEFHCSDAIARLCHDPFRVLVASLYKTGSPS
jgi:hypothetical protein